MIDAGQVSDQNMQAWQKKRNENELVRIKKLSLAHVLFVVWLLIALGAAPAVEASSCNGPIPQGPKWEQLRDYMAGRGNSPGALPQGPKWQHVPQCVEAERKRRNKARCSNSIPQGPKWQQLRDYLAGRGDSPGALPRGSKWQHIPQCVEAEQKRRARVRRHG